ncbi:hypothetical protein PICSAR164_04599 [Mycobacterium avium subsp. paratuberculosis]|nr:hypothetical protein PICSAR124B_04565 [Mycobacterium avium subsp. paratuberculosis]CAG6938741.1 hypothetical protein PICSAR107_04583 [Mycobacterium avium subsp. paratuberculosis]CAG7026939.1 hypothetical protein PICSAR141_04361 [Mycobacterium avium subsp. paratuberculosis]CAG7029905.1 hypothetical protein PICSAR164_04599 [Mycobacterium avium subsp. paratuberculosis]CAG7353235.1 hypothetical protein PICSAR65_04629 [Mycobacterium avium subsp. paratuberculosis]
MPPSPAASTPSPDVVESTAFSELMEFMLTAASTNEVGFSSPLVVKALERLATEALFRKLPNTFPSDPSKKFISPASPGWPGPLVLGARPSQASKPPEGSPLPASLAAWATVLAWAAMPLAAVSGRGGVNGVSCWVAAFEALA